MREFLRNELRKLNEACHEIAAHSLAGWGFGTIPTSDNDGCYEACGHPAPCDCAIDYLPEWHEAAHAEDGEDDPRIGHDCFETAMWNAYPPSYGPMDIYHPDSDFFA